MIIGYSIDILRKSQKYKSQLFIETGNKNEIFMDTLFIHVIQ